MFTVEAIKNYVGTKNLKERADSVRDSLKQVKELVREKGTEIKWTGEYIAAVIGVDRTPHADLVRRANITRNHFLMMKKEQEKPTQKIQKENSER